MSIETKHCVGVIIYNQEGKIYLMRSSKWRNTDHNFGETWTIPGGKIEQKADGTMESFEETLQREMMEELKISLKKIEYVGHRSKAPSDHFIKPDIAFEFEDFIAYTDDAITEDPREIVIDKEKKWYTLDEIKNLPLVDTTKELIAEFEHLLRERLSEIQREIIIKRK